MTTYQLDLNAWDLLLDSAGDLMMQTDARKALAQDVASACRTFSGECWYNTTLGVPYFTGIFGQLPAASFLRAQFLRAAGSVAGVASASVVELKLSQRRLSGQLLISSVVSTSPITVNF